MTDPANVVTFEQARIAGLELRVSNYRDAARVSGATIKRLKTELAKAEQQVRDLDRERKREQARANRLAALLASHGIAEPAAQAVAS